jgi:chemotaxis protein methyltransferase CheR
MDTREYNFIKYKVRKLLDIDLNAYKSHQMQRRLRTYLLRSGYPNWPKLFRALQDDLVALDALRNYLTINVSSFFRDSARFEYLQTSILPQLLTGRQRLRVWSAGCSYGHEPYSLAILLAEATSFFNRHVLLATDIDQAALTHARAGGPYTVKEMANVSAALRQRYFKRRDDASREAPRDVYYLIDTLKRRITFRSHNLLVDAFEDDFDLIVCRNVVIYFEPQAKELLYQRFYEALRPGGILFLGNTEVLSRASQMGFEIAGLSFYRRKDGV